MLDNLNLTHMNGRVYDQLVGRFLSPDAFIDGAGHTQGWNRYSYVKNNPGSFTDPTGFMQFGGHVWAIDHTMTIATVITTASRISSWTTRAAGRRGGGAGGVSDGVSGGATSGRQTPAKKSDQPAKSTVDKIEEVVVEGQQCINADGTIGNDTPGSLQDPHVVFVSLDLEGYLGVGGGFHIGVYRDRTTGNAGVFGAMDGGPGWGSSAGLQVGVARDLASFQGSVSIIGAGYRFISGNYASAPGDLTSPVAVSAGPSINLMPIINVPASVHGGKSYTTIQREFAAMSTSSVVVRIKFFRSFFFVGRSLMAQLYFSSIRSFRSSLRC